jgi:chromosome segregation ATPase
MKKIFGKHLDVIEANQHIAVLEKDLEAATAERDQLRTDIETLKEFHQKAMDDLKAEHDTALETASAQINDLTNKVASLEESKVSAAQQAADIVAKQGVEAPVEDKPQSEAKEDKNLDELWAEHNALSNSKEKRAFYLEHIKPQL